MAYIIPKPLGGDDDAPIELFVGDFVHATHVDKAIQILASEIIDTNPVKPGGWDPNDRKDMLRNLKNENNAYPLCF